MYNLLEEGSFETWRASWNNIFLGVLQRPLTLILLQKYRDTNGRRIVIQIGGVYATFCRHTFAQAPRQKWEVYRDTFQKYRVRGRFDSPDIQDVGKGGLSLRGVAFMTLLAVLAVLALFVLVLLNTAQRVERSPKRSSVRGL